jgi:putative membrane-bound dehydrogenase-like protein
MSRIGSVDGRVRRRGWRAPMLAAVAIGSASVWATVHSQPERRDPRPRVDLRIELDEASGVLSVRRAGDRVPIVTQHAPPDRRPYLHPITAPDGAGVATEVSPAHHPHQTGLYWGFTRANGRDYFHNAGSDHWRRGSVAVTEAGGAEVRWQTVYDLLDASGAAILTETQRWTMRERNRTFELDLEWRGTAHIDVTIGKYDYGGLFLRMPWREGRAAEVVNAARQKNQRAEGQRAMWLDVGVAVDGRDDMVHVAIFDHPDNLGYPQAWRVDRQFGVGSARSREADWRIEQGQTETFRHRLRVYTGTLDDVELTNAWSEYANRSTSALWTLAREEARKEKFLSPEQAAAAMTTVDGYTVNAWAGEPTIAQPMAFCWDDRGRLWVAENHDYETRGRGFSRAGTSRIVILEDTNRDGTADTRTVFMEGVVFPSALAVGLGGVFVGAPPHLLFVPDRDGDDKADVADIEVRLTGWGIQDRHEVLNSLHWGPDGWLYGLQGYATTSKVRKPAGPARPFKPGEPFPDNLQQGEGVDINGGVWRYHPTKDRFEVVAHGFSNPWGIDYDAKGQLLISACVIPHLFHVVPGGVFHRQGGQHYNPYVYSDIQTIADHRHRSAHGGARVYLSDAFPPAQRGRVFMANMHEHAILSDVLERKGSGFTARHGEDFVLANNAQWVGFSMEVGPDGALYVLDWHDADICGNEVLHADTGRIFRVAPKQSNATAWAGRYGDLRRLGDAELAALQTSPSDWHARRARVILQGRAATRPLDAAARQSLLHIFERDANADWRLRAMWTLHVTGSWTPADVARALTDRDEFVRAWAVQLLTEDGAPAPAVVDVFVRLAQKDPSPAVRLYLASALQRLDGPARWRVADGLLGRAEDAADHNLPRMIWLGIEPLVAGDPAHALARVSRGRMPHVTRSVARRVADADALEPLVAAIDAAARRLPGTQADLLEGWRDGLEGRVNVTRPAAWPALFATLRRSDDARVARVAAEVADRLGDAEAAGRNLAAVKSTDAPLERRRRALQTLAAQRRPELRPELRRLLDDPALRLEAIRAVAAFDDESLGAEILGRLATFNQAERTDALVTLASRERYGRMLTTAVATGAVSRRDVPPHIARQLRRVVGPAFADAWGPISTTTSEDRAYTRYRNLLSEIAVRNADPSNGRVVYGRTCGACHKLFGDGGSIGPDLTGSNRGNLDYLLSNVLTPDADVPDAYRMVVITTRDGQTLVGNVESETDRRLTLRMAGRDAVVLDTSQIQSRESTTASLMPAGLFDTLDDRDILDLVAYLRAVEQVGRAR